jgi:ketosteroid isomerase-like protein
MTGIEANKALVNRYLRAIGEGDLTALDQLVAADYQDHAFGAPARKGSAQGRRPRAPRRVS